MPRDVASRNAKSVVDEGRGVGPLRNGVYLDFGEAIGQVGEDTINEALREPVRHVRAHHRREPVPGPVRIYPAVHYTMGGLWVDYHLMSNVPGLFVLGEANFSDHGANRLGASALMQGLADGYFVIPYTLANYLAGLLDQRTVPTDDPAFFQAETSVGDTVARLLSINGTRSVDHFHRELGKIMWENCGMARNRAGLEKAMTEIPALREEFWKDVRAGWRRPQPVAGEYPRGRLLQLGELMVRDALHREESAGGRFREESQTEEGEALRDDDRFAYVAAWEWNGKRGACAPRAVGVRVREADPEVLQVSERSERTISTVCYSALRADRSLRALLGVRQ